MINLLPLQNKRQLAAARTNTVLAHYFLLTILALLLLAVVFGYGVVTTLEQKAVADLQKSEADQAALQFATTRQLAADFTKDLAVAKTILGGDVRFSKIITDIAQVIPAGVILSDLSLDAVTQQNSPITINARAKSYEQAVDLKNSLEKSDVFENVSLVSATKSLEEGGGYSIVVSVSAQFSKVAP